MWFAPSSERWSLVVWLRAYPSSVEVDRGCIASLEVVRLREEFGTPLLYKSSSVEVPSVGILGGQDSGLEILLGEGGDVELGARTSEHIFVFAFDPLSLNPLSLFVLCIIHIIHIYLLVLCLASFILLYTHYMLGLCLCASLILNHESFI